MCAVDLRTITRQIQVKSMQFLAFKIGITFLIGILLGHTHCLELLNFSEYLEYLGYRIAQSVSISILSVYLAIYNLVFKI